MHYSIHWVDEIIHSNCRRTTVELFSILSFSKGNVVALTEELSYFKFCAYWLPQMLRDAHGLENHLPLIFCSNIHWCWVVCIKDCYGSWNLGPPFCTQIQVEMNGMAPCNIPNKNVHECSVCWKNHCCSLSEWDRCCSCELLCWGDSREL